MTDEIERRERLRQAFRAQVAAHADELIAKTDELEAAGVLDPEAARKYRAGWRALKDEGTESAAP